MSHCGKTEAAAAERGWGRIKSCNKAIDKIKNTCYSILVTMNITSIE